MLNFFIQNLKLGKRRKYNLEFFKSRILDSIIIIKRKINIKKYIIWKTNLYC
jgi:hypothetical protein